MDKQILLDKLNKLKIEMMKDIALNNQCISVQGYDIIMRDFDSVDIIDNIISEVKKDE